MQTRRRVSTQRRAGHMDAVHIQPLHVIVEENIFHGKIYCPGYLNSVALRIANGSIPEGKIPHASDTQTNAEIVFRIIFLQRKTRFPAAPVLIHIISIPNTAFDGNVRAIRTAAISALAATTAAELIIFKHSAICVVCKMDDCFRPDPAAPAETQLHRTVPYSVPPPCLPKPKGRPAVISAA